MDANERRQYGVYLRDLADLLRLRDWTVTLDVSSDAGPYGAWWPLFDHQIEFAVDALADMLAFHLPLPERWPERVRDRGGASALASDSREALVNLFFHERKGKPMVWNGVAWQEPDGVMPDRAAGDRQEGPMAE